MKNSHDDGFTFIETIVVIAIVITLSAGVGFSAVKYIDAAKVAATKNQIVNYKLALESYYLDCGVFPTTNQGLMALWEKPVIFPVPESWNGPYLDCEIGPDSWGRDFKYTSPGDKGLPFTIVSLGADGVSGGEKKNADLFSWKR